MSDESIALRHGRSEKEEYKRFMTFANTPNQSRIRHSRRTDSRADSGANTPGIIQTNHYDESISNVCNYIILKLAFELYVPESRIKFSRYSYLNNSFGLNKNLFVSNS